MKCPMHYLSAACAPFATIRKALPLPPTAKGHRHIGLLPGTRDWAPFLTSMARENGDIVLFKYLCQQACLVSHPELIAEVLITRQGSFSKSNVLENIVGQGLATSEGELWRSERRLILQAFHRACLPEYSRVAVRRTGRMLARWREGETRDIYREMTALTLGVAAEAFFGAELGDDTAALLDALQTAFDAFIVVAAQGFLVPTWVPTPNNLRFRRAVRTLHRIVGKIISHRKAQVAAGETAQHDLLSILLEGQQEHPHLTDSILHDEVITFLLGGHETTANALAWTAYSLGQHPDAQTQMAAEARQVSACAIPSFQQLSSLRYAEQVTRESLRLYPPAWYLTRRAEEDVEVGGYGIRKGTTVVMNLWGLHRDARFYANADTFDPDRWTPEFTRNLPQLAYLPFGIGPRRCIGASFAQMEMLTVLAAIVQQFHLELAPNQVVTPLAATTLRPLEGVKVVLHDRDRFQAAHDPRACGNPTAPEPLAKACPLSKPHDTLSDRIGAALLGAPTWATTS
ncbi:MAG TPA: cytochrome P450 [Terriglobia bacterium]|nr:cytochrome P450 [Terriglobia bacterium]